jgi:hypothetical protein
VTTVDEGLELYTGRYGDGSNGDGAVLWCQEVLGSFLWSKQREIVKSVFENRKTAVRSCHSSGKTFVAADIVLAFMCLCYPAKVITTAPTFHQVYNLLWSEIRTKYSEHLVDEMGGIQCLRARLEFAPDWFAVGISPRESVSFQGFHQDNILVVFDEAPGVDPDIVEAAESLMSSGNAHCLWIGNPIEATGFFYEAFRDSSFHQIKISYEDTPNFTGEDVPDYVSRSLISREWVNERREKWGEASPMFMSRCRAEFPTGAGGVIPLSLCEKAVARELAGEGDMVLGVDVGAGGDLTAYTRRPGLEILDVATQSTLEPSDVIGRIVQMHERDNYRAINIDKIGIGWGVVGPLQDQGLPAFGISAAEAAYDSEHYAKRRDELWFGMRDFLATGKLPSDLELIADLTAPKYKLDERGRYKVEKKSETKKRLKRSPDRGDSANLSVAVEDPLYPRVLGSL